MDEAFQAILDSLPPKPARSKLEPYAELIRELRKRGRSYREIAGILTDRCGVSVGTHTVYNFVQVRSRSKSKSTASEREKSASSAAAAKAASSSDKPDEVAERIRALKQRPPTAQASGAEKVFAYDENEPLRLRPRSDSEQKE